MADFFSHLDSRTSNSFP